MKPRLRNLLSLIVRFSFAKTKRGEKVSCGQTKHKETTILFCRLIIKIHGVVNKSRDVQVVFRMEVLSSKPKNERRKHLGKNSSVSRRVLFTPSGGGSVLLFQFTEKRIQRETRGEG